MATLKDAKTVGAPFSNTTEIVRVMYDFSVDGGIATAKDALIADGDIMIKSFYAVVKTTCTGGNATLDIGKTGATTLFSNGTLVASLAAGYLINPVDVFTSMSATVFDNPGYTTTTTTTSVKPLPVKLASGEKILIETNTDAFTAGKIELVFEIAQA